MSSSGSYKGFSASLKVDFSRFQESMSSGSRFGENKVTYQLGSEAHPEPIALKLVPLTEPVNRLYFQAKGIGCPLKTLSPNHGVVPTGKPGKQGQPGPTTTTTTTTLYFPLLEYYFHIIEYKNN